MTETIVGSGHSTFKDANPYAGGEQWKHLIPVSGQAGATEKYNDPATKVS